MKKQTTTALCALLCLLTMTAAAQQNKIPVNEPDYNKPRLFSDLPQKMDLRVSELETLFSVKLGETVRTILSEQFVFEGTVVSKSDPKDASVRSVVIRSTNRGGAVFTFTKTVKSGGGVAYIGRIISRNNGDAFEIIQENGNYILRKKDFNEMISE